MAQYPDDLPAIIFWLMPSGTMLLSLPRTPVQTISSSGDTNADIVKPNIPGTAAFPPKAWRAHSKDPWRPMSELPKAWMYFLNRGKEFR